MRAFGYLIMTLLAALAWSAAAQADVLPPASAAPHLAIRLLAESPQPAAGSEVTLALDTRPQPGWHGYWENPGDAGFPAKLDWTLPRGAIVSPPVYPMPGTLLVAGLMNYVFEAPYAPLVKLKVPAGLAPGTALPIRLHTQYLVCTHEVCVPEQADLSLSLIVGDGAIDPAARARFDAWRRVLPHPLGGTATWQASGGRVRIAIPYPAAAPLD